jgi:hypothetical protein
MNVRQIKEVVLRAEGAEERALALVEQRTAYWRAQHKNLIEQVAAGSYTVNAAQVLLHVIPLFPPLRPLNLAIDSILTRFKQVPPLYCETPASSHRMSLDGYANETSTRESGQMDRSALLLRKGGVEFYALGAARREGQSRVFDVWDLEVAILNALHHAAALGEAGLLLPPVLVSLRLMDMGLATLASPMQSPSTRYLADDNAFIDPMIVNDWAREAHDMARGLFDVVWQSWGWQRSFHYTDQGVRRPFRG